MSEIKKQEQSSPDKLLELAISKDVDIEKLERLMDLRERYQKDEARKAFYRAMADFQKECPVIHKNKMTDFNTSKGRVSYAYATLDQIRAEIQEPLHKFGLSYRWEQKEEGSIITITCIVTHEEGHAEKTTMSAEADGSGTKNSIQAKGSTYTYLQRYSLIGALGISTAQDDVDTNNVKRKEQRPRDDKQAKESAKKMEVRKKEVDKFETATEIEVNGKAILEEATKELIPEHLQELREYMVTTLKNKRHANALD